MQNTEEVVDIVCHKVSKRPIPSFEFMVVLLLGWLPPKLKGHTIYPIARGRWKDRFMPRIFAPKWKKNDFELGYSYYIITTIIVNRIMNCNSDIHGSLYI